MNLEEKKHELRDKLQEQLTAKIQRRTLDSQNDLGISVNEISPRSLHQNFNKEKELNSTLLKSRNSLDEAILAQSKYKPFSRKELRAQKKERRLLKSAAESKLSADGYKADLPKRGESSIRNNIKYMYQTIKQRRHNKFLMKVKYKPILKQMKIDKKTNKINKKIKKVSNKIINRTVNQNVRNTSKIQGKNQKDLNKIANLNVKKVKKANEIADGIVKTTVKKVFKPAMKVSSAVYGAAKYKVNAMNAQVAYAAYSASDYLKKREVAVKKDNPIRASINEDQNVLNQMIKKKQENAVKNQQVVKQQQVKVPTVKLSR